ncbi:MAG: PAS domain S-box protein [Proteobacteria bacterium]|nr:MAG: PAS domain S-box protein [Pseudomonadota bacterium]
MNNSPQSNREIVGRCRLVAVGAGAIVAAAAALALAGWTSGADPLVHLFANRSVLHQWSALSFLALGISLVLCPQRTATAPTAPSVPATHRRRVARILALISASVSAAQLVYHLLAATIEPELNVNDTVAAPATAIMLSLLATSYLLQDLARGRAAFASQVMSLAAAFLALLSLVGHAVDARVFFGWLASMPAAAIALPCAAALICRRTDSGLVPLIVRGGSAATLLKWQVPAAIFLPLTLGAVGTAVHEYGASEYAASVFLLVLATTCLLLITIVLGFWRVGRTEHDLERTVGRLRRLNETLEQRALARARELDEVEERFRSAMHYSPIGLAIVGTDGTWLEVNQALNRIIGYTADELGGMTFQDITHPKDLNADLSLVQDVLDGNIDSYQMDKRYFHKNGHIVWAQLNVSLVRNPDGSPRHFISQIQDISERKQGEQAMQAVSTDLIAFDGQEYYENAVMMLARITGADHGFITEYEGAGAESVRTIARVEDGALAPNFEYDPAGTPCAGVLAGGTCIVADDVQSRYPGDAFLAEKSIRAFVAIPLSDPGGRILGHIGVMKCHPFVDIDIAARTLRTFALAAVAQMVRDKNQKRYQDLFEFAPDALLMIEPAGMIVMANRRAEALFGWSRTELVGSSVDQLVPAPDRSRHASLREAYLKTPILRPMGLPGEDLRAVLKDGSMIPVEISLSPMELETGLMVAVSVRDISERRENQRALDLRNQAIEATGLGVMITTGLNDDCRLIDVNRAFETLTGYDKSEVLGKNPRFLRGDGTPDAASRPIRVALAEGEPLRIVLLNYRKSGEPFWNELSIAPVFDAARRAVNFVGIVNDVTDRVESEERTRTMADALPVLLAYFDKDDHCRMVNRTFEEWFERHASQIIGKRRSELLSPESFADYMANIQAAGGFDREVVYQTRRVYPDGKDRQVEVHHVPQFDTVGQVAGYYTMVLDTTERERTRELLAQSRKLDSIGQLSGGIAHDFNNLLSVIQGNLQLLSRKAPDGLDAPNRKYIGSALDAVSRGSDLTRRLLAFSRRQKLETSVLNVGEHLREMKNLLERAIGEHIELTTRFDDDLPNIEGDLSQFENAILNLVVNARDAMQAGGTLFIETRSITMAPGCDAFAPGMNPGEHVLVVVRDTGKGMTEKEQHHAFEPFYSTKESGKGTGLGLASVFGFVKQSGGHVALQSEVGVGTSVYLYFPVSSSPKTDATTPPTGIGTAGDTGSETILVVDDNAEILSLSAEALEDLGYTILTAGNAAEALDVLKTHSEIRLLFTDIVMPGGFSGLELADKARELRPNLPILFTSGYAEEAVGGNAISNISRSRWIQKPANLDDIARKLRELLDED